MKRQIASIATGLALILGGCDKSQPNQNISPPLQEVPKVQYRAADSQHSPETMPVIKYQILDSQPLQETYQTTSQPAQNTPRQTNPLVVSQPVNQKRYEFDNFTDKNLSFELDDGTHKYRIHRMEDFHGQNLLLLDRYSSRATYGGGLKEGTIVLGFMSDTIVTYNDLEVEYSTILKPIPKDLRPSITSEFKKEDDRYFKFYDD